VTTSRPGHRRGGPPGHVDAVRRVVGADSGDDDRPVPDVAGDEPMTLDALVGGEGGRLPRRAVDDDAVVGVGQQMVGDREDGVLVDGAGGRHRGDHRGEHAAEDGARHAFRLSVVQALPLGASGA
jgi:hypothetical protein